ncbi:hypothetical protein [Fibrella forsythiae]|uniref:Chromosome partition protein Smc n=1 Tax=Fibrella forsythiae TaxID=2817061 RepID=A0ABS3JL65_9BACT|nr:hypothetical protein [Fibrella forsythiae]MBO0950754.1 hypothetical protein [Fibrella forsythiae]
MEPINKAERSASLFNFVLVYLLITAVPVGITYQLAKKSGGSSLNQKAVSEQQSLATEMTALQSYVKKMEDIDTRRPAENASNETWNVWLQEAEKQNSEFKSRVDIFQRNNRFTGARLTMRDNACSYLYRISIERRNYLSKRAALLDRRDDSDALGKAEAEKKELQDKVDQLKAQNDQLVIASNAAVAANRGGGGAATPDCGPLKIKIEELNDQLAYNAAIAKKSQADMLSMGNDVTKRRQLYSQSRQSLEKLTQDRKFDQRLKQQAEEKLDEIDRTLLALNAK